MTTEQEAKIRKFIGTVPPEMAVVVTEDSENGKLSQHGDMCHIYRTTIYGNLLNIRCLGAKSSVDGKVFVVWKAGRGSELEIVEYSGVPVLPEHD